MAPRFFHSDRVSIAFPKSNRANNKNFDVQDEPYFELAFCEGSSLFILIVTAVECPISGMSHSVPTLN